MDFCFCYCHEDALCEECADCWRRHIEEKGENFMVQRFIETPIGETERLTRDLTEAELRERSIWLARALERYNQVEADKKASAAAFTRQLRELRFQMDIFGAEVRTGKTDAV
jgi:hypothetical protein